MSLETSYHGAGAIQEIATEAIARGYKKAFVCSDPDLVKFGVTQKVLDVLDKAQIVYELYSNIKPNPTIENVQTGVEKNRKMVCVDPKDIPVVAFVDPEMMASMPKGLTAATGMDALTHAIEGYITAGAWELSDMFHLKAIEIISRSLRAAVANTPEGRTDMALGQYIAGMGFSNVGLGIVHSMAHPLGALYDTPHGVANAIILPTVMEYNAEATGDKYKYIAQAMGVQGTENMTQEEYRKAAIDAVKQLSEDVGIPKDLKEIVKEEDIPFLAQSAYDDACRPGNPKETSVEDITALYKSLI
jgi:lactaldehyde reductase